MKTTLIQLDESDDILSIKDKMQWNPSKRILLIISHNNKSIQRRLDLLLLQRASNKLGAQLALSSSQKHLRTLGKQTGVKVFSSVIAAQKQDWPEVARKPHENHSSGKKELIKRKEIIDKEKKEKPTPVWQKISFFTLGTLAPILLILILLPNATITISPTRTEQMFSLNVSASPDYSTVSADGKIPAYYQSIVLTDKESISTSGETSVPDQLASGFIRITNKTVEAIELPAHLRLGTGSDPNQQFQTLRAAILPAGEGQFVDIPIQALEAGNAGNLSSQSINSVEGPLNQSLLVSNLNQTSGGSDIKVNAVSENDVQELQSKMKDKLRSEALNSFQTSASAKQIFITDTFEVVTENVNQNLAIGEAGDQLTISIDGKYRILYLNTDALQELVDLSANNSIPLGFEQAEGSLHFVKPARFTYQPESKTIESQIAINQAVQKKIDNGKLIDAILGKTVERTMKIIPSQVTLDQSPKITIIPSFWFWLPLIPSQIKVELQ